VSVVGVVFVPPRVKPDANELADTDLLCVSYVIGTGDPNAEEMNPSVNPPATMIQPSFRLRMNNSLSPFHGDAIYFRSDPGFFVTDR
jgi:hypothetical protein